MPRFLPLVSSFTTGEITERLLGQVDLAKYQHACKTLENYTIQQQGGATRRPGTRFVALAKTAGKRCRLIPFVFNTSNAYMLEVGEGYIRFYRNKARIAVAGVPVEVSTPYLEADLRDIDVRQSADVLYFLHAGYQTRKLERYSDTIWRFRTVTFTPPPSYEFGARPVATVTPSATTGTVTLTASTDAFLISDVAREVLITAGTNAGARATITVFTNTTTVTATVSQDFVNLTATAAGNWKITETPKTTATLSAATPAGLTVTVTLGANGWRGTTALGDSDCGRFAVVNGAAVEITRIDTLTQATGILRGTATGTAAAQSGEWTLEESLWSSANGFGETATFFEDRLYIGSSYYFAGSQSGDYENFGVGVLDNAAVVFAINSDEINAIRWLMASTRRLLIGTSGGEFSASGGTDPITASNVQVVNESSYGSSGVGPVRVGNIVLFAQRSQKKIRELVFSLEQDSYVAPDLLILSEHLTRDATIVEMAHRRELDSIIWAMRSDGVLLGCTYLRDQNVVGWHRHPTADTDMWESVAVIPTTGKDETWLAAKRLVNNSTARTIEVMDDDGLCYRHLNTDCTYTCDSATTVTSFTGLTALNARTVDIVGDGAVYPQQTVCGSAITITPGAKKIEVGLHYDSELTIVRPELMGGGGTSQGTSIRWAEIVIRIFESLGLRVTTGDSPLTTIPFRTSADPMGSPPALFSGDVRIEGFGWNDGEESVGRVTIRQEQPLPSTILMLTGTLDLGGG